KIGAAGYVPKRNLALELRDTVTNVLRMTKAAREQQLIVQHMSASAVRFHLYNDLGLVPAMVGFLHHNLQRMQLCYEADEVRVTVALREALLNAMVRGNLEIPSALRRANDSAFADLVRERQAQAPYCDRRVHVLARETPIEA